MKLSSLFQHGTREQIENYCLARAKTTYLGSQTALATVLGHLTMYVDTSDRSLAPHLLQSGFWEIWVTQAIASYVRPGMHTIDVGANFGYYTLLLANLVGHDGTVAAYEPLERTYNLLHSSVMVNGFGHVLVRQKIVCDEAGSKRELHFNPSLLGSSSVKPFPDQTYSRSVDTTTLDLDIPYQVDFVKIDVQGLEMEVLRGMRQVIERSPRIAIAMEFSPSEHEDPEKSYAEIRELGLRIQVIGTDGQVRPVTSVEDSKKAQTGDHWMLWLNR